MRLTTEKEQHEVPRIYFASHISAASCAHNTIDTDLKTEKSAPIQRICVHIFSYRENPGWTRTGSSPKKKYEKEEDFDNKTKTSFEH